MGKERRLAMAPRPVRIHVKLWMLFVLLWATGVGTDAYHRIDYEAECERWEVAARAIRQQAAEAMRPVHDLVPPEYRQDWQTSFPPQGNAFLWNELTYRIMEALAEQARRIPKHRVEEVLNNRIPLVTTEDIAPTSCRSFPPPEVCEAALYTVPGQALTLSIRFGDGYYDSYGVVNPRLASPQLNLWWEILPIEPRAIRKYLSTHGFACCRSFPSWGDAVFSAQSSFSWWR
jgi:hypothetical protein